MASWKRSSRWFCLIGAMSLAIAGCTTDPSERSSPVAGDVLIPLVVPAVGFVAQETTINNYVVRFDGRTVAGGNTTFTYTVRGTGVDPSLSHFTVELPPCAGAPSAYSPTGSANINTNAQSGIYGIEWHLSVAKNNLVGRTYSITFPGDVPLGIVRAEVKTENGARAVGDVLGPCAGFHVSGTVFVDADNNGVQAANEGGIANVTVRISNGPASITALTDAAGDYDFVVKAGSYTVSIDPSTPAADFNEDLFNTFVVISPTSVSTNVGPSATVDFSFEPTSTKVVSDVTTGVIITNGKPVKFWKTQLRAAQTGRSATYTATQLRAWLLQIEGIGIAEPFQFATGSEIDQALAILNDNTKSDVVTLTRELLASELNFASGNGLVDQQDLHEVLILWGEELVAQGAPAPGAISVTAVRPPSEVGNAAGMFGVLNGSTGGGGTDE